VFDPPGPAAKPDPSAHARLQPLSPSISADQHAGLFERVQNYISAGDIYQANLTFPLTSHTTSDGLALYDALAARQPVPHGAFVDLTGPMILSRSPELFFRIAADGRIETRPMKGTMPRGRTPQRDAANKARLITSEKDRAENLMIVDLLRNDISRIAQIGTVTVPELFAIETYSTVHQMVSTVAARVRPDLTLQQIFTALFPCGSITGAPKIRAMEIIAELEAEPRGAYCGAIGWIDPAGPMEFNVAIRTLTMYRDGQLRLNVGGGIVHDSTAQGEYSEALLKSRFAELSDQAAPYRPPTPLRP
jgi:para-aminobenzoate synthetase component 1